MQLPGPLSIFPALGYKSPDPFNCSQRNVRDAKLSRTLEIQVQISPFTQKEDEV